MCRAVSHAFVSLVAVLLVGTLVGAAAGDPRRPAQLDLHALYQRLQPGMTVKEVGAIAGGAGLRASPEPVTSWLVWNPPVPGAPMAVVRASFRDSRLVRVEYESFGDEYRRLAKGTDPGVAIDEEELRRLWRRGWRATEAAAHCHEALEAFHQLVVRVQDRLTTAEQAAWVRALELRRSAEAEIGSLDR